MARRVGMVRFLRCWRVVGRAGVAYLVAATVAAPYILCIMFLGLMLMMVERSSGPHRYLAAITIARSVSILGVMQSAVESDQSIPDVAYMDSYLLFLDWSAILLAQPFGCRVRFPRFALGFMG